MWVIRNLHVVEWLLNKAAIAHQHNRRNYTSIKTIVLNIFTNNKAKSIHCNLQRCISVYVFWLMEMKGMNIFFQLKKSFGDWT